jgi:hypothetical chaperone protein
MISIGIDFGTSNSSIAVFDGASVRLLPLDPDARDVSVMRSLLYLTREGEVFAGQRALALYTEQNTGREVKLERRWLGEIELIYSDMKVIRGMYALVDVNAPGRLFQSLKRFLADTSFQKTDVFGQVYTLEELVALLARRMVAAAAAALGRSIDDLVVGRPVHFSGDAAADETARRRLAAAWELAGVKRVRFLEEPVAAVHHFAAAARLPLGSHILVFDFGGGTLDVTVTRTTSDGIEVLSTAGVPLGGDRLDSRVMEFAVAPRLGEGARYRRNGLPVPAHLFGHLHSWQAILEMNRPELLGLIRRARYESDRPADLAGFETLVTRNYGFELFQAIEAAKIALSSQERTEVRLHRDDFDLSQPLLRVEFDAGIAPQVIEARACALEAVNAARREPGQIDVVVTTGGSSLIPAFRRMLADAFPRASLQETDTFTGVAAGLARWGAR